MLVETISSEIRTAKTSIITNSDICAKSTSSKWWSNMLDSDELLK